MVTNIHIILIGNLFIYKTESPKIEAYTPVLAMTLDETKMIAFSSFSSSKNEKRKANQH